MIDFHAHILPNMDDGPQDVAVSLAMLRHSFCHGVDAVVSTSHFYADEEYPEAFLCRRAQAYSTLWDAMLMSVDAYPEVILGAEVLYFPGISQADAVEDLLLGSSRTILVEPPMSHWTDTMLDDIALMGVNHNCLPVIAHVDRYMTMLRDESLVDRVLYRGMQVQVNTAYFLNPQTRKKAIRHLREGKIHVIGTDCHNLDSRAPNLGDVRRLLRGTAAEADFARLEYNAKRLLCRKGETK